MCHVVYCALQIALLLSFFTGCQVFKAEVQPVSSAKRLQGTLEQVQDQLILTDCQQQKKYQLHGETDPPMLVLAKLLLAEKSQTVFIDLSATLEPSDAHLAAVLQVRDIYEINYQDLACKSSAAQFINLEAQGAELEWRVVLAGQGLLLERTGYSPLALPYLEERLPDGTMVITSDANGLDLELWLEPKVCTQQSLGKMTHLGARLRLSGILSSGCAVANF